MGEYRLTPAADRDLLDILIYGVERFGHMQADAYRRELLDCFALIADHPAIGRRADAVGVGVRRHEHGSHIMFYEQEPQGVAILAIVHVRSIRRVTI
jgi:toxin ParE1/3/4